MTESAIELPAGVVEFSEKKPMRVLHVDDEAIFLSVAKECLEMRGAFEVDTALSVKEAAEKMKSKEYDVIVCDCQMPEKDGLQFLEELRKNGNLVPFIIFTGKVGEEVAIKAINLGADGYVSKTGDPEAVYCELAHNIRQAVSKRTAEIKLKMSEEKYRSLFENAYDCILLMDLKGNITDVNKAVLEYGFKKEELIGRNVIEFISNEDRPKVLKEVAQKAEGKSFEDTIKINTPKGDIIATYRCKPIIVSNRAVGIQAIVTDVTKQNEIEEKYRETIMNANVGIVVYGSKGEVKIFNPKMEEMTGFTGIEIPTLVEWFEKLYPNEEERRKIRDKWFKKMQENGEVREGHAIITTKEGKRRHFLFHGVQLKTGDSIAFALDVTEQKEAEEKLNQIMEELKRVNEKLSVVGRWTRHDARNKLSVIKSNVYLAKKKLPSDHVALKYLDEIELACNQIVKIFDFASAYEMLGVEERTYVDVGKIFEEAVALSSGLSNVEIVNECHGLMVLADSQLRQLFYNLIDNSLRHGENVSKIKMYYREDEANKDKLKLVYEDDGVGILEDARLNLFREGYGRGTGHGLYLILKLCEMYGWEIQETGQQGKGAQFTLTIPKTNEKRELLYKIQK